MVVRRVLELRQDGNARMRAPVPAGGHTYQS